MRDTRLLVIFFLFSFSFVSFLSLFSVSFFDAANEIFIACFFFSAFDDSNFSRPKLGIFEVSSLFVNVNENNDGYQIGETKQVAASWVRAYSTNIQTRFSPKRSSVWENLIPRFRRNFTRRIVFFLVAARFRKRVVRRVSRNSSLRAGLWNWISIFSATFFSSINSVKR